MRIDLEDFDLLDGTYSYVKHIAATVVVILYVIQFLNKKSKENTREASHDIK